jgi:hypothetical protein
VDQLLRRAGAERAVRTNQVVVLAPMPELVARVGYSEEYLHVQAFVSQPAVERFDLAILGRPPEADEVQVNSVPVCPHVHCLALELGALVDRDQNRRAALGGPQPKSIPQLIAVLVPGFWVRTRQVEAVARGV